MRRRESHREDGASKWAAMLRAMRDALLERAGEALAAGESHGVELFMAGHLHQGYLADLREHHSTAVVAYERVDGEWRKKEKGPGSPICGPGPHAP